MPNVYTGSVQYAAVAAWAATTAKVSTANAGRGDYVRQLTTPAVGSERVYRCTTSGTTSGTEPVWTTTKNAVQPTDGTVVWTECTGQEADQVSGTWNAPHARRINAVAWGAAGDTFYTADNHAETQAAAMVLTYPGTIAAGCRDICVRVAGGTVPPVTADIRKTLGARSSTSTTGNNTMSIQGVCHVIGADFNAGSGAVAPNIMLANASGIYTDLRITDVRLSLLGTATGQNVQIGNTVNGVGRVWFDAGTTIRVSHAGHGIQPNGMADVRFSGGQNLIDTSIATPTTLLVITSLTGGVYVFEGIDFSSMNAKTLVPAMSRALKVWFINCKFPASLTTFVAQTCAGFDGYVVKSNSAGVTSTMERHNPRGVQTTELTVVRSGGAQIDGVGYAMKLAGKTGVSWSFPFESVPVPLHNPTIGANVTLTAYGIWTNGSLPKNDEVWIEVAYMGSAATPIATFASSAKAQVLDAGANLTADAVSVWGAGSTTAFKIALTFSAPQPAIAGDMVVTFKTATTNAVYFDPAVVLS